MGELELEQLRLRAELVQSAADFYESYGNFCLAELNGPQSDLPSFPIMDTTWTVMVDAASAFRQAGQWAMFVDPPRALRLFSQAGMIFHQIGYGFGTFLISSCSPTLLDDSAASEAGSQLVEVLQGIRRTVPLDSPLQHPQQQTYLLLACTGLSRTRRLQELSRTLERAAARSPHLNGVVPIGALGTPIGRYWRLALDLMRLRDPRAEDMREAENSLAYMCNEYARSIESATVNAALWNSAAAPVDVGDVDLACMVSLMARAWGHDRVSGRLRILVDELPAIAAIPLRLGLELLLIEPIENA